MQFHEKRRQQFLGETFYLQELKDIVRGIAMFRSKPAGSGDTELEGWMISYRSIARSSFERILLHYTAGEPIEPLRAELEEVIAAYERYGEYLWQYTGDRNEVVFGYHSLDDYCQLMQLIGLCFLLHRRDLLARLALLQDGEDGANGGADNLYEEFMSHGLGADTRYESDWIFAAKPYQSLSDALYSETNEEALKHLQLFLTRWYKDLAGTGWHDAHRTKSGSDPAGYYGYWSFEAAAAVLLLGIEDDSSLHNYLYYPKDLVAWARANLALSTPPEGTKTPRLRCPAGQPCPKGGYWLSPAKADSRRFFRQDETMPALGGDYGDTIWQWDPEQG